MALTSTSPLLTFGVSERLEVEGRPAKPDGEYVRMVLSTGDPGYFELIRLRLLAGRPLVSSDTPGRPQVAVVNESMARLLRPGQAAEAVGRRIRVGESGEWKSVVGVV